MAVVKKEPQLSAVFMTFPFYGLLPFFPGQSKKVTHLDDFVHVVVVVLLLLVSCCFVLRTEVENLT